MNITHSKIQCPISGKDVIIISYPPVANWFGIIEGKSEIICPYRGKEPDPTCSKESGKVYTKHAIYPGKNACLIRPK